MATSAAPCRPFGRTTAARHQHVAQGTSLGSDTIEVLASSTGETAPPIVFERSEHSHGYHPLPATVPPGHSALAPCGRPPTAKVKASRKSSSERTAQWRGGVIRRLFGVGCPYIDPHINVRCWPPLIDQDIMLARTRQSWLELRVHAEYGRGSPASNLSTFRFRTPSYVSLGCGGRCTLATPCGPKAARPGRARQPSWLPVIMAAVRLGTQVVRAATWNLWWRFGDWRQRQVAIARVFIGMSAPTSPAYKGSGRSQRGTWRRPRPVTWVVDGLLSASRLAPSSGNSGRVSKGLTDGQRTCHGGPSRT
jgi:hypothetical protein